MFDAEDAEFNDIIDEQGVLVGEELLVNEFAADEGEAKAQMQTILAVMEKDQKPPLEYRLPARRNLSGE